MENRSASQADRDDRGDGRGDVVMRLPVAKVDGGYCSRHVKVAV